MCEFDRYFDAVALQQPTADSEVVIPDGLCDLSTCVVPLLDITSRGRAIDSSQSGFTGRFLIEVMGSITCEITRNIFTALLMHATNQPAAHSTTEEVFLEIFSQESLQKMIEEWSNTPYILNGEGALIPLLLTHSVFSRHYELSDEQLKAFAVRHYLSHLDYLFSDEITSEEEPRQEPSLVNTWISPEEFADMEFEADPYNGFEEFYDFFHKNVVTLIEEGFTLRDAGFDPETIKRFQKPD